MLFWRTQFLWWVKINVSKIEIPKNSIVTKWIWFEFPCKSLWATIKLSSNNLHEKKHFQNLKTQINHNSSVVSYLPFVWMYVLSIVGAAFWTLWPGEMLCDIKCVLSILRILFERHAWYPPQCTLIDATCSVSSENDIRDKASNVPNRHNSQWK